MSDRSSELLRHKPPTMLAIPTLMGRPAPAQAVRVRNALAASTMLLVRVNSPPTDAARLRVTRIVPLVSEPSKGRLQRLRPPMARQPMAPRTMQL